MAKATKKKEAEPTGKAFESIIINDLTIVSPDRGRKDIKSLKDSVKSAESVYFPNRTQLYDLYHDVTSMDGHLQGIIQKRINNVLNKKLLFKKTTGVDDKVTKLIRSNAGRDLITQIMMSIIWGISGVEFVIGDSFAFEEIPRKHIKPEKGLITKSQYGVTAENGFKIDDLPFVWVIGKKNDLGLLLACSMYAVYKRGNFGDWSQYVEIFGQPVRICYYDAYDTKTKTELRQVLDESGSSLAMMIPKQARFEMLDGKTSNGTGELQASFKDACNQEMSICILGNTETTSSSKSSGYAQSKEHAEQQDQITSSDLAYVENLLNSEKFLSILSSYGFDVNGGSFEYEIELNLDKLKLRLEIDKVVSQIVPVADDHFYDTYGIPKPDNYDELKAKMESKDSQTIESPEDSEPEPQPAKGKKAKPQEKKKKSDKPDLIDTKDKKLRDRILKGLADFFDRAQH